MHNQPLLMKNNQTTVILHLSDALSQQNPALSLWQDWIHSLQAYIVIDNQAPLHLTISNAAIEIDSTHLPTTGTFQFYLIPGPHTPYGQQAVNIVTLNGQPVSGPLLIQASDWQNHTNRIEITLLPPAIVIDCRAHAKNPALSSEQLAYLEANGNNATLFIHGFDVPVGAYGLSSVLNHQNLSYSLYREDSNLNGSGAYDWFVCMEHNLNVAAGFDGKDYSRYTRIIGIMWDGHPPSILDYVLAVKEAFGASTHLLGVLKQLLANKIAINLMAHSLGNQVLLNALENLGQAAEFNQAIDHVVMWEAAVPDNSFSDPAMNQDFSKDYRFPNAHKSLKKVTAFYSEHDNILGPVDKNDPDLKQKLDDPSGGILIASIALIINWFDDFTIADHVKSVYNIANMFGTPFSELLKNPHYRENFYRRWITLHPSSTHEVAFPADLEAQKLHLEAICPDPFNALSLMFGGYDKGLLGGIIDSEFNLVDLRLKQWLGLPEKWVDSITHHSYKAPVVRDKVGNDMAALIITVMISKDAEPRPALGYSGPLLSDPTTADLLKNQQLFTVDQTAYYFTHSALRIPSSDIMNLSYKAQLMSRGPQGLAKFGLYF
ncbi:MAG: alpha/beta hydrolase [Gammaproteobacteria bacterium]|nr:alpha/beta hydrolase [Gammaproteobacteria bacterium]